MTIESGTWRETLEYAAGTDVGMRRGNNQDAHIVALAGSKDQFQERGHLLVVADGMGAHAAGELASQMAIENVPHNYFKTTKIASPAAIRKAVQETNRLIHAKGQASADFHGMGTTCSSLLLLPEGAVVAHVGDSRVYRFRNDRLEQLTFDHSLVWEMAEAGHVDESDVPKYIPKNVITRSLGPHATVDTDLEGPFPIAENDRFLICSDGLSGPVQDIEIGMMLGNLPPREAVQTLIDLANLRGGPDNITVVVTRNLKIDTSVKFEDADTIGREMRQGDVHSVVWGSIAFLLVILIVFLVLSKWVFAGVAGVGLMASILIAFIQRKPRPIESRPASFSGPLGRGPYRNYDCKPSESSLQSLRQVIDDLRNVAEAPDWDFDTTEFTELCEKAEASSKRGHFQETLKCYASAIRKMMEQAREQRKLDDEDSHVL